MIQQQADLPEDNRIRRKLLHTVYDVYSGWVERFPLACQKGCSACCTQSVTMTSLEGRDILDYIKRNGTENWLTEKLAKVTSAKSSGVITTNQYAAACLGQRDVDMDTLGSWDFTPCIFLEKNICSIYEVRPFGCRSFGSLVRCSDNSGAEAAQIHLTINTIFTQIIEHLSSDGGYWGNMYDLLKNLIAKNTCGLKGLLPAEPIPGFLLEPHEIKAVHVLLRQLYGQSEERQTFGDLIDNFIPIL